MKKKRIKGSCCPFGNLPKFYRTMKLICLFMFVALLQVSANSYSQTKKLTLVGKNLTLEKVFELIEDQSEFSFLYNLKQVDLSKEVDVDFENEQVEKILNHVLEGSNITYTLDNRLIVIHKEKAFGLQINSDGTQQRTVSGKVTDSNGQSLPGVTVVIKGTTQGTVTNADGNYSFANLPVDAILQFSFVGMKTQEVIVGSQTTIDITLQEEMIGMEEVVVVGYGTQKKSDITGSVASVGKERLELVPNLNVAQAIQGAIPGVMMQTTTGGVVSEQTIMIRGRNSILADNSPLIVVDGITYTGEFKDLNPNDIESIEVLKDASSAAIYGSRGANGVILITSKEGKKGKPRISYNGYYSVQSFVKFPDLMNGDEFYNFKMERAPEYMTETEQEVYKSGQYANWINHALRDGNSTEHNISISGGFEDTKYYISGGVLKVKGLAVNDDYLRLTSRINLDTKITDWLTIGTRTQLSYDDLGGLAPRWEDESGVFMMNPLTIPYDENGNLTIHPWPEDVYFPNPLQRTLATNNDESYQVLTNNYASIDFPFIPGLQYRIETGLKVGFHDTNTYYGRDTESGFSSNGSASTGRYRNNTAVIENIMSYNRDIDKHNLFFTGVYSYESNKNRQQTTTLKGFPNDFLLWYAAAQAEIKEPRYGYNETTLLSQMLRLNYSYDSRYLATLTGRRDGYSGFGAKTKWGIFPSVALGWNMSKEGFFPWKNKINEFKLRVSYGLNGNQAVGAYRTISRLGASDYIEGLTTLAGYMPANFGNG